LVVIERTTPLGDIIERGVEIGAVVSKDLLETIFYPDTPLHDGAVIIRNDRIMAAGCILPLAVGLKHRASLGTRHRAAMGITEESDAVALVVSEERGTISVAISGKITTSLEEVRLKRVLISALER
ncbi:MAG: DNA integrity scanning protein DisA nucleotide-binding domain protein, partial [Desulfoplanes sp.]|nr:DNA integrity scanning protein DisA nucleotide-binding domain protein [Desulfoplanes sp.]